MTNLKELLHTYLRDFFLLEKLVRLDYRYIVAIKVVRYIKI